MFYQLFINGDPVPMTDYLYTKGWCYAYELDLGRPSYAYSISDPEYFLEEITPFILSGNIEEVIPWTSSIVFHCTTCEHCEVALSGHLFTPLVTEHCGKLMDRYISLTYEDIMEHQRTETSVVFLSRGGWLGKGWIEATIEKMEDETIQLSMYPYSAMVRYGFEAQVFLRKKEETNV